uniref:flagellin n=1 Tax=Rhabdaerophilum sp. SD176 TaxID=2983548 RepID=UPI0024E02F64
MSVVFNAATAANVSILRTTNELFSISQKRVATGKKIFGAADDATRYNMSQTMLSRSRNINAVNNNISTALKTLESTDIALKQVRSLLQQMNDMATQALAAGSTTTISANPTANINANTYVVGYSNGMRLSITSDSGDNFTYTFGNSTAGTGSSANVTWGQVAQALNASNIGVQIRFEPNGTGSRLVLESSDRSTGFSIDGRSSAQVVDDLVGINSSYDSTYHSSKFANGSASPTGFAATSPNGMRFGAGGFIQAPSSMPSASANSSIS